MGIQHDTISAYYLQALINGARRRGHDPALLLSSAGISLSVLDHPEARVFPDQIARLVTILWLKLDDEFMGLSDQACQIGTFALCSKAVIYMPTLQEVVQYCRDYYQFFLVGIQIQYDNSAESTQLQIQPLGHYEPFFAEFLLLCWNRFASWLIGSPVKPQQVCLPFAAPAHAEEYQYLFGCPVNFDSPHNSLMYTADYLQQPVIRSPDELPQLLINLAQAFLHKPERRGHYSQKVRHWLREHPIELWPDVEEAARHLHLTGRTLRRKLDSEGSSYQDIKNEIRRALAIQLLRQQRLSINEIARQLGFTEASAFIRAFKQWTGAAPSQYQRDFLMES